MAVDTQGNIIQDNGQPTGGKVDLGTNTLTSAPTTSPSTGAPISTSSLAPTTPANYQAPNQVPVFPVSSLNTPSLGLTGTEQEAQTTADKIKELNQENVGQAAYRTTLEGQNDIAGKTQAITDLTSRLTTLKNEAQAIPLQLQQSSEGRGITTGGLAPIQAAAVRENAIQSLATSSQLEAARGNLTTALALVDRAVKQKFDPVQEEINAKTANLQLILKSPEYTVEDKNRAQAQLDIQNNQKAQIEQQKTDYENAQKAVVDLIHNNPKIDSRAVAELQGAKNATEVAAVAAKYGLASEKLNTQVVEVNGRRVLINQNTGATIKDLGAVTAKPTPETATIGPDLADAQKQWQDPTFRAAHPNVTWDQMKQIFLAHHPSASAQWNAYFNNGEPSGPPSGKKGLLGLGFLGL